MRKAEILRERLVKDAKRVRKKDPPLDLDIVALPDAPGAARKIAEAVDRDDGRLLKRRDQET